MLTNKLTGAGAADKTYIEDVFSTYLYTGNDSTQTINNGIDLAGKGGLVWIKNRNDTNNRNHALFDTARGVNKVIYTNNVNGQYSEASYGVTNFSSSGFTVNNVDSPLWNQSPYNYASWTFRKAPKFFDVVTYTGNGATDRAISHSLGQAPGMIIVKCISTTGNWGVRHFGIESGNYYPTGGYSANLNLLGSFSNNDFFAQDPSLSAWTNSFKVNSNGNLSGQTYVAYLFGHDTTTDGLIQCGSYIGNGSATGSSVTLGWEPQYLMIKNASGAGNWQIIDNMRGMPVGSADATLQANLSNAESSVDYVSPTATGFQVTSTSTEVNLSGSTYIYMAIRRGPMRTPTNGTEVFKPLYALGAGAATVINTTITPDLFIRKSHSATYSPFWIDRLRDNYYLASASVSAESAGSPYPAQAWDNQTGINIAGTSPGFNSSSVYFSSYAFKRAPGFFDVVCYTGDGVAGLTVNHNLGVAPELMIVKRRALNDWYVYSATTGANNVLFLNGTNAVSQDASAWNGSSPSSVAFQVGANAGTNLPSSGYVAYLFASCPGVSKVGSYTGNGSNQTINCGFSAGARFVLIKRTDSTGDWYVWNTARGIVAATDPHLSLNTTAAEVDTDDSIDPTSTGFIVNQVTATNVNVNAATYIYLAIA